MIRNWIDDGGELSLGGADSIIYCDSAIADACREAFDSAEIRAEAPGVTLDRLLAQTDDTPVVWVAADLWFDIAEAEQVRTGQGVEIIDRSDPIAHSPLVLVAPGCEPVGWACFIEQGPNDDIGIDSLDSSSGVAAYSQAIAARLNRQDFATNDFSDPGFAAWRREFTAQIEFGSSGSSVVDIYTTRRGTYDSIATVDAFTSGIARSVDTVNPADGGPPLQIRAVAIDGARLPGALGDLEDALVDQGWQAGAGPEVERPSGGAMQALRS